MRFNISNIRYCLWILFYTIIFSCGKSSNKQSSIEIIANNNKQDSIFRNLIHLTNNTISEDLLNDSLAFLILPVQASCPSCRNKTIDSIAKHKNSLVDHHFIIISAKGGHKTINSYFKENNKDLPVIENKLFLDSTNEARRHDLYDKKPTIYYTYKKKAYKKVSAIPASIRQDLQEFFSGYRNDHN